MLELLRHYFLPHETNNHRPKLFHHTTLLSIIAITLVLNLGVTLTHIHAPQVLGVSYDITVDQLLALTNQRRVENGLQPLSLNNQLTIAATNKAADMFAKNYWAHNSPDGITPWYFIKGAGYEYEYAGENLARGFTSASDVVAAWMNSPGHRENLLSPNYSDIGFAVSEGMLTGDDTVLVVQEFGRKAGYVATTTSEVAAVVTSVPITPTPTIAPITPTVTPVTALPTVTPLISSRPPEKQSVTVAGIENLPLINEKSLTVTIAMGILAIFITTLIIDMILIKKKNIVRLFTHNLDHIIFFTIMLFALWIISKGVII